MANKTNRELIDLVFKDPEIKYGLKVFSPSEIEALQLSEDSGKISIYCPVSAKKKQAKPEEVIRQLTINRLVAQLSYPLECLAVEVPIKMGSTYASKKADIVVYLESNKLDLHAIIEVKKPLRKDGLEQLHSYMNATGVYWGGWINGNDEVYQLRMEPNLFEVVKKFPALGEGVDDVKTPIKKSDLEPINDLKAMVQELEDTVLANAGVNAFEEIFKLIFTKLWDEFDKGDNDTMDFRSTTAPPAEQYKRIAAIFDHAKKEWGDIFGPADKIELSPEALVAVASAFQTKRFLDTDLDVIDAAFEHMINPEQKGDKGQFFTPRQVVKMCVRMLNPRPNELALDPACGPCGFMIHTLNWVADQYIKPKHADIKDRKQRYASSKLFAIDFDPRLAKVAKAMMLIAGDGRTHVFRANSLDPRDWKSRADGLAGDITDDKFDVLMTNPPFAGNITQPEVLGGYDLAYKGDPAGQKRSSKMTRDVLFIERCLRFLKPGGRMAIVLPQSNLNNTNAEYIRHWVMDRARVLAVVGLQVNTFKPFTGTKTSVLFLQKWATDTQIKTDPELAKHRRLEDYPIFMATSENTGKNNRGEYVFKRSADGSYVEEDGKRQVDHDLDLIAEGFREFAKAQGLGFQEGGK